MHETSLIKDMLLVAAQVRKENGGKPVKRLTVELSEFGGMDEGHFRFHYAEEIKGTDWQGVSLEIKKVAFGEEAKLVSVTFGE